MCVHEVCLFCSCSVLDSVFVLYSVLSTVVVVIHSSMCLVVQLLVLVSQQTCTIQFLHVVWYLCTRRLRHLCKLWRSHYTQFGCGLSTIHSLVSVLLYNRTVAHHKWLCLHCLTTVGFGGVKLAWVASSSPPSPSVMVNNNWRIWQLRHVLSC